MDSDQVARRIAQLRQDRRLTREAVAAKCAELGRPEMTPAVLANLEGGRRDSAGRRRRDVRVDELAVLAVVLDVPVVSLLVPVGSGEPVELLPGTVEDSWTAYRWIVGEFPTGELGRQHDLTVNYFRSDITGRAISAYRRHHSALHSYLQFRPSNPGAASAQLAVLAATRIEMHRAGWWLPPLPDDVDAALVEPLAGWGYKQDGSGGLVELPPAPYEDHVGGMP